LVIVDLNPPFATALPFAPQRVVNLPSQVKEGSLTITPSWLNQYALVATGSSSADLVIVDLNPPFATALPFAPQRVVNLPSQVKEGSLTITPSWLNQYALVATDSSSADMVIIDLAPPFATALPFAPQRVVNLPSAVR